MAKKENSDIQELQNELKREIGLLRRDFQTIVERYKNNAEAEMVNAITILSALDSDEQPENAQDSKQLEFMLQSIRSLKYKKNKGRMKDLRRIHSVVKLLAARFSE